jgi:hypothetical protein
VAVLSSGNIVAAGFTADWASYRYHFALASFDPRGNPDGAFGTGGQLVLNSTSTSNDTAYGMAVANNGDVIVAGSTSANSTFALMSVTTEDSLCSAAVFDWQYYLAKYPALRASGITTEAQARAHWLAAGIAGGLQGCETFLASDYLARYSDLRTAFGSDYRAAISHYVTYGLHEGRLGVLQLSTNVLLLNPAVFDWQYYLANNPDLGAAGITTQAQAKQHWLAYGINEGRRGAAAFDPRRYLEMYPDLQNAFGLTNYRAAIQHYVTSGRAEGRDGNADAYLNATVFNWSYYLANNPDLGQHGITTQAQAELHWLSYGVNEGRRASATFWSQGYYGRYADLQAAFGGLPTNKRWRALIQHWVNNGRREGRLGV